MAEGWLEDAVKQKLQDCLEEGFLDFALSENVRHSFCEFRSHCSF